MKSRIRMVSRNPEVGVGLHAGESPMLTFAGTREGRKRPVRLMTVGAPTAGDAMAGGGRIGNMSGGQGGL